MIRPAEPDIAELATIAARRGRGLRPALLRLHAQAFASATRRDRRTIQTFEALASGLIPLVPPEMLAEIADILLPVDQTPPGIMDLLVARMSGRGRDDPSQAASRPGLDQATAMSLCALLRPDVDLALARNPHLRIDGHLLEELVGRAAPDCGPLALALLARAEPGLLHRATLYRAADAPTRAKIREGLTLRLAVSAALPPRQVSAARRTRILKHAVRRDLPSLLAEVGRGLKMPAPPAWRTSDILEAELLALALTALGLPHADCERVFLTVDPDQAHSVAYVFRLAGICRTTDPAVAAHVLGLGTAPRRSARLAGTEARPRLAGTKARAASATPALRTRRPGATVPDGRRSRSTKGPGRS